MAVATKGNSIMEKAKRFIWNERQRKSREKQIELARLMQNTKSASELMRSDNDRTKSRRATFLEFIDNKTMTEKHDKLRKYIISMTRVKFKLRTVQKAISDVQRIHSLKGKFEGDETRVAEDVAGFEYFRCYFQKASTKRYGLSSSLIKNATKVLLRLLSIGARAYWLSKVYYLILDIVEKLLP